MNPLRLLVLLVSLPLLLGGCGEKHEREGVNAEKLEEREGIMYLKGSDIPYTGKVYYLYPNGQKGAEANYKEGKRDGLIVLWHENGQKKEEVNMKDGKEDGLYLTWHENGQKSYEGIYKDGEPHGLFLEWHENSKKKLEVNWKDGELISEKFWNSKGEPVDTYEEAEAE